MPKDFDFPKFDSSKIKPTLKDIGLAKISPEEFSPLFIKWEKKLNFNNSQIRDLVKTHVIEVKFKRRLWPLPKELNVFKYRGVNIHKKPERRMLCTANWKFLMNYQRLFKFIPPMGIRPRTELWYRKRNLIIVWDLILRDWRMISLDDYDLVMITSIRTKEKQEKFIENFKKLLKLGRRKLIKRFQK